MAGRDRSAEVYEYCDRNTAAHEHIQRIFTPIELITRIIVLFKDDLEYQRESLRIIEELLDFPALNRARRSPPVDDKKRKGVMADPHPKECKSPRTESSASVNPDSGNPSPGVVQQRSQLDESTQNVNAIPSIMVWETSRGEKSKMLATESETISVLGNCIDRLIRPGPERKSMKEKVEELQKMNELRVQMLERCVTEEEKAKIITEVGRVSSLSGYNINDYLFRAMEGDMHLVSCLGELTRKMLDLV